MNNTSVTTELAMEMKEDCCLKFKASLIYITRQSEIFLKNACGKSFPSQ